MSSSDETSKIDLLDDDKTIKKKINAAFCEPRNVNDNSILTLLQKVIFPVLDRLSLPFAINRT